MGVVAKRSSMTFFSDGEKPLQPQSAHCTG